MADLQAFQILMNCTSLVRFNLISVNGVDVSNSANACNSITYANNSFYVETCKSLRTCLVDINTFSTCKQKKCGLVYNEIYGSPDHTDMLGQCTNYKFFDIPLNTCITSKSDIENITVTLPTFPQDAPSPTAKPTVKPTNASVVSVKTSSKGSPDDLPLLFVCVVLMILVSSIAIYYFWLKWFKDKSSDRCKLHD